MLSGVRLVKKPADGDDGTAPPGPSSAPPPPAVIRDDWMGADAGGAANPLDAALAAARPRSPRGERHPPSAVEAPARAPGLTAGAQVPGGAGPPRLPAVGAPPAPPRVGDGGASWRLKALKRAQAEAASSGRDVSSVVSERWGSVGALTAGVDAERAAHARAHLHASRDRGGGGGGGGREREGEGARRAHVARRDADAGLRRPAAGGGGGSLSWRRSSDKEDKRSRERRRSRSRSPRPRGRDRGGAAADAAAALAAAAPSINAFASDGSFFAKAAAPAEAPAAPAAPPPPPPPPPAGAGNRGAAAALRARLGGRAPPPPPPPPPATLDAPLVDAAGRAAPGAFGRAAPAAAAAPPSLPPGVVSSKRGTQRYDDAGARTRWFADDEAAEGADVASMAKRARLGDDAGAADTDAALAAAIVRQGRRYRDAGVEGGADDEYDYDGGLAALDGGARAARAPRRGRPDAAARARAADVAATRRSARDEAACAWCLGGPAFDARLVVAASGRAYVAAPARGRLAPLHCVIAPAGHAPSERAVDDDTATEMRNFKKCVVRMHAAAGCTTLFFETAVRPRDGRAHARVHAVPLPPDAAARAPAVLRAALEEAADEWSTHAAKRMVDTTGRGLAASIPPGFAYFHAELGLARGWLHVVDDGARFGRARVGEGVAASLLGREGGTGRPGRGGEGEDAAAVAGLRAAFREYDWTGQQ